MGEDLCIGRTVYAQIQCGSDKAIWLSGVIVSTEATPPETIALLEVPSDRVELGTVSGALEVKTKSGTIMAVPVRGVPTQFRVSPLAGYKGRMRMTAREALPTFGEVKEETYMSLSEPESSQEELLAKIRSLESLLAVAKRGPSPKVGARKNFTASSMSAAALPDDSDVSDEEEGDEDDELAKLALEIEKSWTGAAGSKTASRGAVGSVQVSSQLSEALMGDTRMRFNMLMMQEMIKSIRQLRKKKDGSSDSDEEEVGTRKVGKSLRVYRILKSRVTKAAKSIIKNYHKMIKEELGLAEGQAYTLRDWGRRIPCQKHRTLQKCFEIICGIEDQLEAKRVDAARAQLIQCLEAIHQCVLEDDREHSAATRRNWR